MTTTSAIAAAQPGLWHDDKHRYFYGERGPLPSVTTILDVLDKSGPLVGWAKRETAASAIRNLDMLQEMVRTGGKDEAQAWLSRIPDYQRDEAAKLGTLVHSAADSIARGVQPEGIPEGVDIRPYVTAYQRFVAYARPRYIRTEAQVAHLGLGYGGTLDISAELFGDGVPTLLDVKSGNNVYNETSLQLVGYDRAEFTATPDDPTQIPLTQHAQFGVLHLRPDGTWTLYPMGVGDREWEAFQACLNLYRWSKDSAPWVKGTPYTEEGGASVNVNR